jgi:hypothetical protein
MNDERNMSKPKQPLYYAVPFDKGTIVFAARSLI